MSERFTDVCKYCGKDIRRYPISSQEVWGSEGLWIICDPFSGDVSPYHMPRPLPLEEVIAGLQLIVSDLR